MKKLIYIFPMILIMATSASAEPVTEETSLRIAQSLERIANALENKNNLVPEARPKRHEFSCFGRHNYYKDSLTAAEIKECETKLQNNCLLEGFQSYEILARSNGIKTDEDKKFKVNWIYQCNL